jgi:hypothetical protein
MSINMSEMYQDRSSDYINHPGFHSFAYYTPLGIRIIDRNYMEAIQSIKNEKEGEDVRWSISRNAHLHQTIKDNLILNLDRILDELTEGEKR